MKLINHTHIPTSTVRKILLFCRRKGVITTEVELRTSNSYLCYGSFDVSTRKIIIGIGDGSFPIKIGRTPKQIRKGYSPLLFFHNKTELLAYLLFHEYSHLCQLHDPYYPRVGRRKHRYSESDADAKALILLDRWRKKQKEGR